MLKILSFFPLISFLSFFLLLLFLLFIHVYLTWIRDVFSVFYQPAEVGACRLVLLAMRRALMSVLALVVWIGRIRVIRLALFQPCCHSSLTPPFYFLFISCVVWLLTNLRTLIK